MSFPVKKCIESAQGCLVVFVPRRPWQVVCENKKCGVQHARKITARWRKKNPSTAREYQNAYRNLIP